MDSLLENDLRMHFPAYNYNSITGKQNEDRELKDSVIGIYKLLEDIYIKVCNIEKQNSIIKEKIHAA